MAKLTKEDILAYLEEATILELNDVIEAIEEKFGVSAAAPVAVAAVADAGAAAGPSEVTVTLTDIGATKVAVIKAVREIRLGRCKGLGRQDSERNQGEHQAGRGRRDQSKIGRSWRNRRSKIRPYFSKAMPKGQEKHKDFTITRTLQRVFVYPKAGYDEYTLFYRQSSFA